MSPIIGYRYTTTAKSAFPAPGGSRDWCLLSPPCAGLFGLLLPPENSPEIFFSFSLFLFSSSFFYNTFFIFDSEV
jgi:hypothetical protein